MNITIIDYGMGNLHSIESALKFLNIDDIVVTSSCDNIKKADKLILPGVGSFKSAIDNIKSKKLDTLLEQIILIEKKPILGICLGMQLLCKTSTENGFNEGLSIIDAEVDRFSTKNIKVPHVGFDQVKPCHNSILYKGLDNEPIDFYFTHSYKVTSEVSINGSLCNYGDDFIASFENENIFGVQFHPELSQTNGLKLLKNFIEI